MRDAIPFCNLIPLSEQGIWNLQTETEEISCILDELLIAHYVLQPKAVMRKFRLGKWILLESYSAKIGSLVHIYFNHQLIPFTCKLCSLIGIDYSMLREKLLPPPSQAVSHH